MAADIDITPHGSLQDPQIPELERWAWLLASAGIAGVEIRIKMSRTELSNWVKHCTILMRFICACMLAIP